MGKEHSRLQRIILYLILELGTSSEPIDSSQCVFSTLWRAHALQKFLLQAREKSLAWVSDSLGDLYVGLLGIFCPLTSSGTIIVDDVLCSCFASPKCFPFTIRYSFSNEHHSIVSSFSVTMKHYSLHGPCVGCLLQTTPPPMALVHTVVFSCMQC